MRIGGAGCPEDVRYGSPLAMCGYALASDTGAARPGPRMDELLAQELHLSWRPALSSHELPPGTAVLAGTQSPQPAAQRGRYARYFFSA